MCIASVAKITKIINASLAEGDFNGVKGSIKTDLVGKLKKGGWVLVHAGFAIKKVPAGYAKNLKKLASEAGII
jgi:hydrogenase expression/formation protein HypC